VREVVRRNKQQETGDTIMNLLVQAAGYFVMTAAAVWLMFAYLR
jgi:hypothetical protein